VRDSFALQRVMATIGARLVRVAPGAVDIDVPVRDDLTQQNGYLHAGAVVSLADTCCGYATVRNLPEGAEGFTTIELKSNFIGSTLEGDAVCVATPAHKGRTTQVWNAEVHAGKTGKAIAHFRCTQMILYPRSRDQ